jgi:flagellar hook-length control protein FliK
LNTPEFAPALGAQVVRFVRDGIEHARMRLNPAELGPVAVQLAVDGTQVRVDLVAEIAATRQVLEQGLPVLAGALRDAGFTLSGGGVFQQARDGGGGARDLPSGSPRDDALGSAERISAPAATRARRAMGLVDTFV